MDIIWSSDMKTSRMAVVSLAPFRTAFTDWKAWFCAMLFEVVVGNTLHQKRAMHGHIVHIPIVQPLLSREYSTWEQVGALEVLQHSLE